MRYYFGLDLGSTAAKAALVDEAGRVVLTRYERHNGRALEAAARLLREMMGRPEQTALAGIAVTGSAARPVSEKLALPFYNEVVALAVAMRELYPEFRSAIEVGGQDAKIVELSVAEVAGGPGFQDFSMNTECAAGTGSFLDQQASRLGVRIEDEFGAMALRSKKPPRVAGRCSVFAKSDMIHLQQQAVADYDIVAGLCFGMARNFKANLARGKDLARPVALVGGVASNAGMVRAFREVFEFAEGELRVPQYHDVLPAIGAALCLRRDNSKEEAKATSGHREAVGLNPSPGPEGPPSPKGEGLTEAALDELVAYREAPAARQKPLQAPEGYLPSVLAKTEESKKKIGVYLGVDVGSISTNLVLVDEAGGLLAKVYIMTAGRPIEAVRSGLGLLAPEWAGRVEVRGVGTTGSGRYLTGDIVGADVVRNEITAQARGAAHEVPDVDTIFEIGGQDSKYIRLRNGVVVDFEMNHVCAAGTGSFLEEQAERLGISIKEEFAQLALSSRSPVRLGERCTVFMESDLMHQQQQGAALEDLVAGLSYSIAANYLNRVVGTRGVGRRILFQGGTAFNRAVTAAFAELTGQEITVPPHHEVTGALGAALLVREARGRGEYEKTAFRGFELAERKYEVKSFTCNSCANFCDIREVRVEGQGALYYGSRCDRYNKKKAKSERGAWPDLFAEREEMLLGGKKETTRATHESPLRTTTETEKTVSPGSAGGLKSRGTVGIPRALIFHQMLPFWRTLLDRVGYEVVLSPATDAGIIQAGVESVVAQVCFPVKVAQGHVRWLVDHGVDYVLIPSVTSLPRDHESQVNNHLCPYVQSLPYQVEAALGLKAAGVKVLAPVVALEEGYAAALPSLKAWGRTQEISSDEMNEALEAATAAQGAFETACRERGREILASPPENSTLAVLVSRPYNGCDAGLNMDVARRMRDVGLLAVPMDFLDLRGFDLGEDWSNLYWKYGQKIVRAAEIIRERPDLQAVYISNFGCGPDSFLRRFFQEALGDRPLLALEIDEHSAPAGLVTRLEAFVDSLKGAKTTTVQGNSEATDAPSPYPLPSRERGEEETITATKRIFPATESINGRTLLVPQMCDHAFAFAAAFRGAGLAAQVIPASDEESLALGRQWTSGRECLPCIVTAGDMLRELRRPGADPAKLAFFMPSGTGPCRFGMYNRLHQLILRDAGFAGVPIVSPNQGASFYRDFKRLPHDPTRAAWQGIVAIDALLAALHAVRPYETTAGAADAAYRESLRAVEAALERGGPLGETMEWCANRFAALAAGRPEKLRPRVGIVGEIYVRSHTFSNQDLVRRLEGLGLEVELAGFAEWIYYTNWTRKRRTRAEGHWRLWLGTQVKDRVQRADEAAIKKPFRKILGDLREAATGDVVALGSPYIHDSFEGEAVLSVGKALEMAHGGTAGRPAAGVVNVMPFTCMPGNIVAAVLKRLRREMKDLPMLSISYDGQRDSSLDIRLEAFAEQVKAFAARHHN